MYIIEIPELYTICKMLDYVENERRQASPFHGEQYLFQQANNCKYIEEALQL